jgi:hypothetical protein
MKHPTNVCNRAGWTADTSARLAGYEWKHRNGYVGLRGGHTVGTGVGKLLAVKPYWRANRNNTPAQNFPTRIAAMRHVDGGA